MHKMCRHNEGMERKELFDVVAVRGAEALPFLHSQCAADLSSLTDGQLRWSALLNPQGRVMHVIAAIRLARDEWRLLVPFARGPELVDGLSRLLFRRKALVALDATTQVELQPHGYDSGISGLRFALAERRDGAISTDLLDQFIAAGMALIAAEASGRHLAHALRLDRFDAFSVNKGCYPGQEIVARTHFLGRNKRILVQLGERDDAPWQVGDTLWKDAADVGEIACAGQELALAVLNQSLAVGEQLTVGAGRHPVRIARSHAVET